MSGQGRTLAPAIFLDRDGVINRAILREGRPYPPQTLDEMEILPGVREAVRELRAAGFRVIVITNQPDVATGKQSREVVEAMHRRLREEVEVDGIYVCYHSDADGCECRKPKAGLIHAAARECSLDLAQSFLVGDRWRDIDAAKAAGCTAFFIDYGYQEELRQEPDRMVDSLADACALILSLATRQPGNKES